MAEIKVLYDLPPEEEGGIGAEDPGATGSKSGRLGPAEGRRGGRQFQVVDAGDDEVVISSAVIVAAP